MELFEFAKDLGAEVQPVQGGRKRVTSQTIERLPAALKRNAMDHHAFVLKFRFVLLRQCYDMNIMTKSASFFETRLR